MGRQRSNDEGDSKNWRIFTASTGAALRTERRGALSGSDEAGALRFLDTLSVWAASFVLVVGILSLDSATGCGLAPASVGFSGAAPLV